MTQKNYLAIEIGGTKLQMVVGDELLFFKEKIRLNVDKRQGAAGIRNQIAETITEIQTRAKIAAVGVGFGGPVDWKEGKIYVSHQIEGWSGFDLAGWLQSLIDAPVFVDNDANVAGLGEAIGGAGEGFNPVFYVTLGSGVGGGLVVNKQIYHGATPGEAEVGHIRLDRSGATIESICSGWAVDQKVRQAVMKDANGILSRLIGSAVSGEAKYLKTALERGDVQAKQILQETAQDLAFGLSHVVHLFHPEVIILGGGLSLIGEPLQKMVASALPTYIMEAFLPGPQVLLAKLGEDAVPAGALALARNGKMMSNK